MSRRQDHTEYYQNDEEIFDIDVENSKRWSLRTTTISMFVMVIMIVLSIAMFVMVIMLYKKVDGLENNMQSWRQEIHELLSVQASVAVPDETPVEESSVTDVSEVVDLAEAVVLDQDLIQDQSNTVNDGIRRVYLTFDDGPSSNTDRILDILASYGVKATFFVVGKENYADQYRRIVNEGHTLAMHSFSHRYKEIYASVEAYEYDLNQLHDFLYELTGEDCTIVRFPGGSSNKVSRVSMRELIAYLNEKNIAYFDWNISSGDASGTYLDANQIANNVLSNINRFDTAVVLFHDAASKDSTVEALPIIIEKILESDNAVLLPISEDTVKIQHLQ